jgi:peptidoglycan L-alanyl-D-glutamate endopeptidase CwlK
MPKFGKHSWLQLATCDDRLFSLFNEVVKRFDCYIIWGHRGEGIQNQLYKEGASTKLYPNSKHNIYPSKAVDVYPYIKGEISYGKEECYLFAGYVLGIADQMGIPIRCGADWDMDRDISDQTFNDICHFEIVEG